MKSEASSPLQKATFILLLMALGCLAFLVTREFTRSGERAKQANASAAAAGEETAPTAPGTSVTPPLQPAFAPLRPRVETNIVRTVTNRVPPVVNVNHTVPPATEPGPAPAGPGATGQVPPPVLVAYPPRVAPGQPGVAVFGRATLRGVPPPEKVISLDALCGRLVNAPITTRHFAVGPDAGLANVFVYIKTGAPKAGRQISVPVLDNVKCEFQPYVLGVRAGQPFVIRNSDPVLHNAHLMPKPGAGNREANIGLPPENGSVTRLFEKPEVFVKVKCDVHPWMFAYLGVVEHPWFAVTDPNGNFTLPLGLPAGQYPLTAVHLKAGELTQSLTVGDGSTQPVSFEFEVPKPLARTP